jgi:hypothetical protein
MSDTHSHSSNPHSGGPAELHELNLGKIVLIGVVSLAIFAAGVLWAYELMVRRERGIRAAGPARVPSEIGKPEIGIVDQVPFEIDHRLEIWRAERTKRLSTYGWVDRAKGIVHIPIDRAMQEVVANPPDIPGQGVPLTARSTVGSTGSTPSGAHPPAPKPSAKP